MLMFFLMLFSAACSRYETPELPNLDKESFSTEEILQKQQEIRKRISASDDKA
jgi:hypothetical protein